MSSLAARLQQIQLPASEMRPDMTHLSLDQLRNQKITFGRTHTGRSFQHMWDNEQGWITWFVQRYSESTKAEHLIFLRYVELEVEHAELTGTQVPVINLKDIEKVMTTTNSQTVTLPTPRTQVPKAKAKSMPMNLPEVNVWGEEEDPELFAVIQSEPNATTQSSITNLENRILGIENALAAIMQHIENQGNRHPTEQ